MTSGMTPAKKFVLRAAMVSGSTVALIVGAQTLITVDAKSGSVRQTNPTSNVNQNAAQPSEDGQQSIRVIRGANGPILLFSRGHEESWENHGDDDDQFFNQGQSFQFDQQSQQFNSQQSFSFPRTSSSR